MKASDLFEAGTYAGKFGAALVVGKGTFGLS